MPFALCCFPSSYDRKKYMWKLAYMYMMGLLLFPSLFTFSFLSLFGDGKAHSLFPCPSSLMSGYDVEVGHMEALKLISSQKYSEKNAGYIFLNLWLTENSEIIRLLIQAVKNDLNHKNDVFQCLALAFVGRCLPLPLSFLES
jgi:hypothetical protein